jgi:hypothetical protein
MAQRTACLVLEMHDVHAVSVEDLPARDELPATIVLTEMITSSPTAALVFPIGFATSRTGGRHIRADGVPPSLNEGGYRPRNVAKPGPAHALH